MEFRLGALATLRRMHHQDWIKNCGSLKWMRNNFNRLSCI